MTRSTFVSLLALAMCFTSFDRAGACMLPGFLRRCRCDNCARELTAEEKRQKALREEGQSLDDLKVRTARWDTTFKAYGIKVADLSRVDQVFDTILNDPTYRLTRDPVNGPLGRKQENDLFKHLKDDPLVQKPEAMLRVNRAHKEAVNEVWEATVWQPAPSSTNDPRRDRQEVRYTFHARIEYKPNLEDSVVTIIVFAQRRYIQNLIPPDVRDTRYITEEPAIANGWLAEVKRRLTM